MKVTTENLLGVCPSSCDDAAIEIDHRCLFEGTGMDEIVVTIDCAHSGVCVKRGGIAYKELANKSGFSPLDVMCIDAALQNAIAAARMVNDPTEVSVSISSIGSLIACGIKKEDVEYVAQKIVCYGSVEKWLEARDAKKELSDGEA